VSAAAAADDDKPFASLGARPGIDVAQLLADGTVRVSTHLDRDAVAAFPRSRRSSPR